MKRLSELIFKYIGRNKIRTAMTIFAIIISTFVIFSIFTIGLSIDYSKKMTDYEVSGSYDAVYVLNKENAEKLYSIVYGSDADTADARELPRLSNAVFMSKGAISSSISDFSYFGDGFLLEGEYPKNPDEVIISGERALHPEYYVNDESEEKELKVGDEIIFHFIVYVGVTHQEYEEQMRFFDEDIERRAFDKYRNNPEYKDVIERIEREGLNKNSSFVPDMVPYAEEADSHLMEDYRTEHTREITVSRRVVGIYDENKISKVFERYLEGNIHNEGIYVYGYTDFYDLEGTRVLEDTLTERYRELYGGDEKIYSYYDSDIGEAYSDTVVVEATFASKKGLEKQAVRLGEYLGSEPAINYRALVAFDPNDENAVYDTLIRMAIMMVIAAIFAIIVMVIVRNAFNISVNERERDYGMYRIIGLTRKQIIKMILFEAAIVGIIGILAGVLLGIYADMGLFAYLNNNDSGNDILSTILKGVGKLHFRFSWTALGYTVAYMVIIVGYSMVSPVERLYRLSPVSSLQSKGDIDIVETERKTKRMSSRRKRIRNYPVWYGFKSMKVRRNRLLLLVFSMGICVALSFAVGCSMRTVLNTEFNNQNNPSMIVTGSRNGDPTLDGNLSLEDIEKIIENISVRKGFSSTEVFSNRIFYPLWQEDAGAYAMFGGPVHFYGMSERYYKLTEELVGEPEYLKEDNVINAILVKQIDCREAESIPQVGDTITIAGKKIHIAGQIHAFAYETMTQNRFPANEQFSHSGEEYYLVYDTDTEGYAYPDGDIAGDDSFMVSTYQSSYLYIFTDLEKDNGSIQKYLADNGYIYNDRSFNYRKMHFVRQLINMVVMVVLLIITINLINIRSSDIYQRRREFRLLRNIGFSKKDVGKAVLSEGIAISIYAVIFGSLAGTILSFLITRGIYKGSGIIGRFDNTFMNMRFSIDWNSLLAAGLVTMVINTIVGVIALKLLRKEG